MLVFSIANAIAVFRRSLFFACFWYAVESVLSKSLNVKQKNGNTLLKLGMELANTSLSMDQMVLKLACTLWFKNVLS